MISEKITIDEMMIRVLPGGFIIGLVFFVSKANLPSNQNFDFLYSFLFFCLAFIVGEILQTLSHGMEFFVDIFFKGYRPSEIFLYDNNPICNNKIRGQLIKKFNLTDKEKELFEKKYSSIPLICPKKSIIRQCSQDQFWRIYANVEEVGSIRRANVSYLFTRVMIIVFLISCLYLFSNHLILYSTISLAIMTIFIWRAKGIARGLVFKTSLIYLKGEK